jgi:hypothetical protein
MQHFFLLFEFFIIKLEKYFVIIMKEIGERYLISRESESNPLGQGSFGIVFKARDTVLQVNVAMVRKKYFGTVTST